MSVGLASLSTLQELPDDLPQFKSKFNEGPSIILSTTTSRNNVDLPLQELQTKFVLLSAEANRLFTNNLHLSSELQILEQRCLEAEKLVGRTITVTIDKNLDGKSSSQRTKEFEGHIYELNDRLEMAKNIIVKQNKEIYALKNRDNNTSLHEDIWKQKYYLLENKFDDLLKSTNHSQDLERKLKEAIETSEELKHQSAKLKSEIYSLTEQLKEKHTISEEKESLEIQLDSCKIDLETSKEEIEMLRREIRRMLNPNDTKLPLKNINVPPLQRINNLNTFGKRFCLKFLKSIRGDDSISDIDSCFDDQGKFTTGRFQTSPEQVHNFYSDPVTTEDDEKRYTAKEMNRLRKEIVEYEQIIMFLSQKVNSSLPQDKEEVEKKLVEYIKEISDIEANKNDMKNLFEENNKLSQEVNTYREKVLELEEKTDLPFAKEWEQQKQQIGEYQSKIIKLEQDKKNMQGKIEEYEKTIQKLNQRISHWKAEFHRLEMLNKNGDKNIYEKAIEALKQKSSQFEKNFDVITKQNQDLKLRIKNIQQELVVSNQKIADLTANKEGQDDKNREKWLNSYDQMEEIVRALESKKESMQGQLTKMREIIESNNHEIFDLTEINQRQEHENQLLIQEIQRLKQNSLDSTIESPSTKGHRFTFWKH